MKELVIVAKITVLVAYIVLWNYIGKIDASPAINSFFIVGCVLLMVPITLIGRKVLDSYPAKVMNITTVVQALRLLLGGIAITRAIKTVETWTMGLVIPVPEVIGLAVLIITGAALAFTMINLAARGFGAPALEASVKLATDWLYGKMRNPMVLALFVWLIAWGLYLQSMAFILWVAVFFIPVEVFFEKRYEERELELRFGEGYLRYKANTPFMFPRFNWPQLSGKTIVAGAGAGKHQIK